MNQRQIDAERVVKLAEQRYQEAAAALDLARRNLDRAKRALNKARKDDPAAWNTITDVTKPVDSSAQD